LLQRVFGFEVLVCDRCGGRLLGAVTEPHAVRRLLAALGLAAEPTTTVPEPFDGASREQLTHSIFSSCCTWMMGGFVQAW
jgi:hypothetical protein